jgi:glycosyltransferase involved in cell wall biosynthesis
MGAGMSEAFNGKSSPAAELRAGFSVVICTYKRARLLEEALGSVLAQSYPKERYELIIVDNNSSDETQALVERYRSSASIAVSHHLEPRPGASFARNLGIERARHEYIAFLDDDTVAGPGWLAGFDVAVHGYGALAGGGPVEPVLDPGLEPPIWWREHNIRYIFGLDHAHLDSNKPAVAIRWPLWLGACNSFYSKRLLEEHGGFRLDCGPVGPRYRVAQDVELNVRLERAGVAIYYVRDSRIKHRVTAERLTRRYIWRRAYTAGITNAAAWAVLGGSRDAGSVPQLVRPALRLLLFGEPARTAAGCRLAYGIGYLQKSFMIALGNKLRSRV